MDNLYYYIYDVETKTIKPKYLGREARPGAEQPKDIIIGMEFYAPEKNYAEQCAKDYNSRLVKNITELESADKDALYIDICKECGRAFATNKDEYMWFKSRDLVPPKRCVICRRKRKAQNNKENK